MRSFVCAALLSLLPALPAYSEKVPVEIAHSGNDSVGRSVVFSLKEAVRASQSMRLDFDGPQPRVKIVIVSMDLDREDSGQISALSVSYLYDSASTPLYGAFITANLLKCGSQKTESCARELLVEIDAVIEELRRDWPSLWKTLRK